jgi:hypothetical protein
VLEVAIGVFALGKFLAFFFYPEKYDFGTQECSSL